MWGCKSQLCPYLDLFPQVDTNHDRLVTLEEFLASTQQKEFGDTGEGWEVKTWSLWGFGSALIVTSQGLCQLIGLCAILPGFCT